MVKSRQLARRITYILLAASLLLVYLPNIVSASQITARTVTIGSSAAGVSTTYLFNFTVPSATVIQSAGFAACTTASGVCTSVPGFSASSSTLTSQPINLGDAAGWLVDTAMPDELRLSKSGNIAAPTGNQTVGFSGVVNPSATNSTFFLRMSTYSDDSWVNLIDTGVVAASTAGQITVTATVAETLTFTMASATVALGALSTSSTGAATSSMTVATNAASGYSISYSGNTLTSGLDTIAALNSPVASSMNSKQFGINLMANTTPAIGSNVSGSGSGAPAANYNTADLFKFHSGDTIASSLVPTNSNTYTVSYIANIDGVTAPGAYSTTLTYVATTNF